jgi:hypothetical protein
MNHTSIQTPLEALEEAIAAAQALPEVDQIEYFKRQGMPEISHWMLRRQWETQGRLPDETLQRLHQHEWAHGLWAQAMARLDGLDVRRVGREAGIYLPDVVLSVIARDAQAAVDRIAAEVRRDAFGLGLRLCFLRNADLDGYRAISDLVVARRTWEKQANRLGAAALRLALELENPSDRQAFEDIEALLELRDFRHICPFFRWRYQRNIALLRRYTDERLRRSDPTAGLAPHALFAWTLLVWVFGGDQHGQLCQALAAPDTSSAPDTPVGAVYHAAAAYRQWIPASPPLQGRRLRIALCVFGQLRHFQAARPSWNALRLDTHDVQVFVHTWRNTGMRIPDVSTGAGTDRVFGHAPFAQAYKRAAALYGIPALYERCRTLHAALDCGRTVSDEELRTVYGAQARCVIEDDPGDTFGPDPANQRRMFRKMHGAVQLMRGSGQAFDLCILIRPDLLLKPIGEGADLMAMATAAAQGSVVFNDCLITTGNIYLDDTMAIGRPDVMEAFVDVESFTQEAAVGKHWNAPTSLRAHRSIAHNAFVRGLRPVYQLGFRKAGLASAVCLSREQIQAALLAEMPHGAVSDLDRLLLSSLEVGT